MNKIYSFIGIILFMSMQTWAQASINLSASPTQVSPGGKAVITWSTSGATYVYFSGLGYVAKSGSRSVYPTQTTTYTVQAYGRTGWVKKTVTVTVATQAPPTISTSISPDPFQLGKPVTLSWTTTNATSMNIDQGIGSVELSGSISFTPSKTVTYTLTAAGPGGTTTKKITFTVPEKPTASLTANPELIEPGEAVTLTWSSSGANSVRIDPGLGAVAASGSVTVHPQQTTSYTLTAANAAGTTEVTATVAINSGKKTYAFISHRLEKAISVVNLETLKKIRTVSLDFSPAGLALTHDGMWLYVADPDQSRVHRMSTQGFEIKQTYEVTGEPQELLLHPGEEHLFILNRLDAASQLLLLKIGGGQIVNQYDFSTSVSSLCISKNHGYLYLIEQDHNLLSRYSLEEILNGADQNQAQQGYLDLPGQANSLTLSVDGAVLYAATDEKICFLDLESFFINYWFTINDQQGNALPIKQALSASDPDKLLVILKRDSGKLYLLDRVSNSLKSLTLSATGPSHARLIPNGDRVVIATVGKSPLALADIATQSTVGSIDTGLPAAELGLTVGAILNPVSGRVIHEGQGLADVEVSFEASGETRSVKTDATGIYLLGLETGTYLVKAKKTGYRFEPQQLDISVIGPLAVPDMTAFLVPPSVSMSIVPQEIQSGKSATLTWQSEHAETLLLQPMGSTLAESGSLPLKPSQTTVYTIVAQGPGGSASAEAPLTVLPLPRISLSADPLRIPSGGQSTLTWSVEHADTVEITPNLGTVALSGQQTVKPSSTTRYTLKATGPGGVNQAEVTVEICPLPLVSLSLVPGVIKPGESAKLSWSTTHADSVTLNGEAVGLREDRMVSPAQNITYTLVATSSCSGSVTKSVTLTVTGPPQISFTASPEFIGPGQKATLTWQVTNSNSVSIDQSIGSVAASGSREVSPTETTTYLLTATGSGGTSTASVTVKSLKNQLQQQWNQMRMALQNGNVEAAMTYFNGHYQDSYRQLFNSLGGQLPAVASEMGEMIGGEFSEVDAKFIITRKEMYEGVLTDFAYDVIFVRDENGAWKILRF